MVFLKGGGRLEGGGGSVLDIIRFSTLSVSASAQLGRIREGLLYSIYQNVGLMIDKSKWNCV